MTVYLQAMGAWQPGYETLASWHKQQREDCAPAGKLLPPALRRRATHLTKMVCDAYHDARASLHAPGCEVAVVVASALGELAATIALLNMMIDPAGVLSPTLFHNSVHNTSTGYLSIATGNRSTASAVAAGGNTLAAGFLEALMLLSEVQESVVILAEERGAAPFNCVEPHEVGAFAFWLSKVESPGARSVSLSFSQGCAEGVSGDFLESATLARELCATASAPPAARVCIGYDREIDTSTWLALGPRIGARQT